MVLLALHAPLTAYADDLDADLFEAAEEGKTALMLAAEGGHSQA